MCLQAAGSAFHNITWEALGKCMARMNKQPLSCPHRKMEEPDQWSLYHKMSFGKQELPVNGNSIEHNPAQQERVGEEKQERQERYQGGALGQDGLLAVCHPSDASAKGPQTRNERIKVPLRCRSMVDVDTQLQVVPIAHGQCKPSQEQSTRRRCWYSGAAPWLRHRTCAPSPEHKQELQHTPRTQNVLVFCGVTLTPPSRVQRKTMTTRTRWPAPSTHMHVHRIIES